MTPQIIIAAIIAACGFGSAWQIQNWRQDAKEKQRAESELAQVQHSAATAIRRADNTITAQNESARRAIALRRDADLSRAATISVSLAAGEAMRRALDSHQTCLVSATALDNVFQQCAERRRELAEIADRHANDVKTLMDAFPK
jgi:hypothetical protein